MIYLKKLFLCFPLLKFEVKDSDYTNYLKQQFALQFCVKNFQNKFR